MKVLKRILFAAVVSILCVGCDQGTKALAGKFLAGRAPVSLLGGTVRLHYSENPGLMLGFGAQLPDTLRFWVFTVSLGIVLAVTVLFIVRDSHSTYQQVFALSLILGGGIGNLIDRVLNDGAAIDFLNIGVGNIRTGIFNLADVAVFGGVALLFLTYPSGPPEEDDDAGEPEETLHKYSTDA